MDLNLLGSFAGGIGLFLLGMKLMTDGFKLGAGQALRHILRLWTRTPVRGLLSGVFITSIMQSSSAVTVATIGFVNAGLLSLSRTISVIYGSNIGSTMTGWLVVLIGFKFDIKVFALPLIGLGMLLSLTSSMSRREAMGQVLAGFGLFFLGVSVLKTAFAGFSETVPLAELASDGFLGMSLFVGIGFLLTFMMQSSSAAIAVILAAMASNVMTLPLAAAAVIGANLGTTSTAVLASLGATSNGKRVAAAHVFFNLVTGAVAFILLPLLLQGVVLSRELMVLEPSPLINLALFHTIFNIFGVALLWIFTPKLVEVLERQFITREEDVGRPRYLDNNVVTTPTLALDALNLELERISDIAREMAMSALSTELVPNRRMISDKQAILSLVYAVGKFTTRMQQADLSEEISESLSNVLRVTRYYTMVANAAVEVANSQHQATIVEDEALAQEIAHFRSDSVQLLELADPTLPEYSIEACEVELAALEDCYQVLKAQLLRAGVVERLKVHQMVIQLDQEHKIRRMLDQYVKGARYLADLVAFASKQQIELDDEE